MRICVCAEGTSMYIRRLVVLEVWMRGHRSKPKVYRGVAAVVRLGMVNMMMSFSSR